MIRKYTKSGNVVEFHGPKSPVPGGQVVDNPQLQMMPVALYVGEWKPGLNQPTTTADTSGPYKDVVRYLPVPESEIQR